MLSVYKNDTIRAMDKKIKKDLKALAHHLNPVIITGNHGLTPAVHQEIDVALDAHELIKLRLNAGDRDARKLMTEEILTHHKAELIQQIGHTITIYRQTDKD